MSFSCVFKGFLAKCYYRVESKIVPRNHKIDEYQLHPGVIYLKVSFINMHKEKKTYYIQTPKMLSNYPPRA